MIKPVMLWNFIKTCGDNEKVGRVCRTLGRQKVDGLTEDEKLLVRMIDNDSDWMDEWVEERKRKDRERKRIKAAELREKLEKADSAPSSPSADSTDSTESTESADSAPVCLSVCQTDDKPNGLSKENHKEKGGKEAQVDELFAQFWAAYPSTCPRKIDKKKCAEKFRRIVCDAHGTRMEIFSRLMDGLEAWKKSDMWTKDDGQFICAPAVWLNGSRWEDSPLASRQQAQAQPEAPSRSERVYDQKRDWLKCAEDCANCTGNGCGRGVKVPPVYQNFPPSECANFRPIGR